jgi:hypothetical protein
MPSQKLREDELTLIFAMKVVIPVVIAFGVAIVIDIRHAVEAVARIYGS